MKKRAKLMHAIFVLLVSFVSARCFSANDTALVDQFVNWKPCVESPVLSPGPKGAWDENMRERMWVVYEDGQFYAWYCGWKGPYDKSTPNLLHLGYATSDDGVHWTKHPNNPVFAERWVEDICVVKVGNTYYMYAEDEAQNKTVIHLLTSTDKVNWIARGDVLRAVPGSKWEGQWVGTPVVWREEERWLMIYEGGPPGYGALAFSNDGLSWNRSKDNPVMVPGGEKNWNITKIVPQSIIRLDGRYHVFYHAINHHGPHVGWQTGLATSNDLVHWRPYKGNPILKDKSSVVVKLPNRFLLYTSDPSGRAINLYISPR